MKWSTSTTTETSSFLNNGGNFHVVIEDVNEQPTRRSTLVPDAIELTLRVVGARNKADVGRTFRELFRGPELNNKESSNEFRITKRTRLLVVTSIMDEGKLGQMVDFNPQQLVGRQFCAEVDKSTNTGDDGKTYTNVGIAFCNFYHVDDVESKDFPRDMGALAKLPADQRRIAGKPAEKDGRMAKLEEEAEEAF